MAIKVPLNEEISEGGRKGIGSAIRRRRSNRATINSKKRERGGVVWRDIDPYIIRIGIKRRKREEIESSEKDKPCLTKMMTRR